MVKVDIRSCPKCGSELAHVVDSRLTKHGWVRRRRICLECDNRWSSYEIPSEWFDVIDSLPNLAKKISQIVSETESEERSDDA